MQGLELQFVKILALNFIAFTGDGKRPELQFTARLVWRPLWRRRFLWQSSGGASTGAYDWYYVGGSRASPKTTAARFLTYLSAPCRLPPRFQTSGVTFLRCRRCRSIRSPLLKAVENCSSSPCIS
ncbi:hypothetical protein Fot_31652 [Forsythia ovata]|uniref:Uncharacterized protein n=1 Tax=Forsythia ovata TaxID=205694 RepID=A0ABD1T5K1_9LAMI